MGFDNIFAWVAIGIAASLAGMIWPFRRGAFGVFLNLAVGAAGGLVAGMISHLVLPPETHGGTPLRLLFAAVGSLAALGIAHAVWARMPGSAASPRSPSPPAR